MGKRKSKAPATFPKKQERDFPVIVTGGSAGGFKTALKLFQNIPEELSAAILIVLHNSPDSNIEFLIQHVQQHTRYKCKIGSQDEKLEEQTIYFAVPGMHLMLSDGAISYGTGPEENGFKPSIDILFRTAAVNYRERVNGIILSGLLDDGVNGMMAIQKCGGRCIVQDPLEAEFSPLPTAVLSALKPDYVLSAFNSRDILLKIAREKRRKTGKVPGKIKQEAAIAAHILSGIDETSRLGMESLMTCPDCGGVLFYIDDKKLHRYRCFTGHAYSEHNLINRQKENIESSLWVALRLMEERRKLLSKIQCLPHSIFRKVHLIFYH